MAGLVPAIYGFFFSLEKVVNARHKAGHDGGEFGATMKYSIKA
ncbi:MAG: hypothetical protein PSV22_02485 [Pseudolabrys sp.]|nr:hypothetical protein [Pseudolabrys sp.]